MSRILWKIRQWWRKRACRKSGHVRGTDSGAGYPVLLRAMVASSCARCGAGIGGGEPWTFTIAEPYGISEPTP
ncbi:MAG: hypothetical protein ACYC3F_16830 [Gemmatimonadaceae bacterium]